MIELPMPTLEMRDFDGIPVWTDVALFAACGVRVAFAGRNGGISAAPYDELNLCGYVGDDPTAVARNRARLLEVLGAAGFPLVAPRQIHGLSALFRQDYREFQNGRLHGRRLKGEAPLKKRL